MRRFYLPPPEIRSDTIFLTGGEAHHAAHVLRVRPGENLAVLDGAGRELECLVEAVEKKQLRLRVSRAFDSPPPPFRVTLFQAVPKGGVFESIIEKATELGVSAIVPLLSERVAVHLDETSSAAKAQKWQQTAIEAIKQCGQRWLPRVHEPQSLAGALALAGREKFDFALVGALQDDARHPREYFSALSKTPAHVAVWIGPEGDLTPAELDSIRKSGALPITLGPLVLRSETAALYALSIINYELRAPVRFSE